MLSGSGSTEDASGDLLVDGDLASHSRQIADCARLADRARAQDRVRDLTEQMISETGRGLDLAQADLSGTDLSGFDLRYAILNRASLHGTRLAGADLTGASLVCAGMERTDFTDAILKGAYVHSMAAQASNFTRADLGGLVDATGALFHGATSPVRVLLRPSLQARPSTSATWSGSVAMGRTCAALCSTSAAWTILT